MIRSRAEHLSWDQRSQWPLPHLWSHSALPQSADVSVLCLHLLHVQAQQKFSGTETQMLVLRSWLEHTENPWAGWRFRVLQSSAYIFGRLVPPCPHLDNVYMCVSCVFMDLFLCECRCLCYGCLSCQMWVLQTQFNPLAISSPYFSSPKCYGAWIVCRWRADNSLFHV